MPHTRLALFGLQVVHDLLAFQLLLLLRLLLWRTLREIRAVRLWIELILKWQTNKKTLKIIVYSIFVSYFKKYHKINV